LNYWDTSALLKLYVAEADSAYFLGLVAGVAGLLTSDLARVELYSALARKESAGELAAQQADQLFARFRSDAARGRISTIPAGSDVMDEAGEVIRGAYAASPPVLIRSIDAIHVASALILGVRTMVATDTRLRAVARQNGLSLLPRLMSSA